MFQIECLYLDIIINLEVSKMNIGNINKAELFAALYNAAGPENLAEHNPNHTMTEEEALIILMHEDFEIENFNGRSINIDFSESEIDPHKYNESNGANKAEAIISALKSP